MPNTIRIDTPVQIGQAIRTRRKAEGLTLVEVAGLIDVGVRFLSELENGKPTVRLDKLLQVIDALGLQLHLTSPSDSGHDHP